MCVCLHISFPSWRRQKLPASCFKPSYFPFSFPCHWVWHVSLADMSYWNLTTSFKMISSKIFGHAVLLILSRDLDTQAEGVLNRICYWTEFYWASHYGDFSHKWTWCGGIYVTTCQRRMLVSVWIISSKLWPAGLFSSQKLIPAPIIGSAFPPSASTGKNKKKKNKWCILE